jgi:Fe-S oxidoreductase
VTKMAAAGCVEASLGFESGCPAMLRNFHKQFDLDQVRTAAALLRDHGIRRTGFLLLGGPGETRESIEESLVFADSLALDQLKLTTGIRIYPGTALERTARQEGVITPGDDLLLPRFYWLGGLRVGLSRCCAIGCKTPLVHDLTARQPWPEKRDGVWKN